MNVRTILAAVLLASLLMSADALAQTREMQVYTVQRGDTCGSIANRFYGNWRRYDIILRFNPQLVEGIPESARGACGPFL